MQPTNCSIDLMFIELVSNTALSQKFVYQKDGRTLPGNLQSKNIYVPPPPKNIYPSLLPQFFFSLPSSGFEVLTK
jgi:hypothetical protein